MSESYGPIVVAVPRSERALIWTASPLLGAMAAWLLTLGAGWIADLAWAPFQGPFRLVASIDEPYASAGALAIGVVAGVAFAVIAARERVTVSVAPTELALTRGTGQTVRVARSDVGSVFLDGKQLVVLGPHGQEHDRVATDLRPAALRAAFVERGYRWRDDGDPWRDDYRLWVPDMPGLPDGANALLAARAVALEKGKDADAAIQRAELVRLGVVVREEKKRQYWRLVGGAVDGR